MNIDNWNETSWLILNASTISEPFKSSKKKRNNGNLLQLAMLKIRFASLIPINHTSYNIFLLYSKLQCNSQTYCARYMPCADQICKWNWFGMFIYCASNSIAFHCECCRAIFQHTSILGLFNVGEKSWSSIWMPKLKRWNKHDAWTSSTSTPHHHRIYMMAGRAKWNLIKNRYKCIFKYNFHRICNSGWCWIHFFLACLFSIRRFEFKYRVLWANTKPTDWNGGKKKFEQTIWQDSNMIRKRNVRNIFLLISLAGRLSCFCRYYCVVIPYYSTTLRHPNSSTSS